LTFSQNWDDVRRTIEAHPELLSDTSVDLFGVLIARLREVGDLDGGNRFEQYRDLLVLAREIGVEDAIAEMAGEAEDISAELQAALAALSESLTASDGAPEQLGLIRRALELATLEKTPKIWVSLHGMLGDALLREHGGDRGQSVEDALDAFQKALSRLSKTAQPVLWAITMSNLARAYTERVRGAAEENTARAAAAFREALGVFTGSVGPRIVAAETERSLLGLSSGSAADLRRAVDHFHQVLVVIDEAASTADGVVDLPRLALLLGGEVSISASTGTDEDAPAAVPEDTRVDEPAWGRALAGARLLNGYWESDDVDALRNALEHLEDAARSIDASSPHRADVLGLLGKALRSYHKRIRAPEALDRAIVAHRQAVALLPSGSPTQVHYLADLAEGLHERHHETGERADLDEAIALAGQAAALTPRDSPERPTFLRLLGDYYRSRYSTGGDVTDLDASLAALRLAEELTRPDASVRYEVLASLSAALFVRYGRLGDLADLDQAIECDREAADLATARSRDRAVVLHGLGRNLARRYGQTGQPADLDEAIRSSRQALALVPVTAPDRAEMLNLLGTMLNNRYELAHDAGDLDESIELWQQAVELSPPGTTGRATALNALSTGLRDRYFRTGDLADLARAVELVRAAVELTPPGSPSRSVYLIGLGTALRLRYLRGGDLSHLNEANALWREALDCTAPTDPERPEILNSLATGLLESHRHTGDGDYLREGIDLSREALDLTAPSSLWYATYVNTLAAGLMERFWQDADPADLDRAVTLWRRAVEANRGGVSSRVYLPGNLAGVLSIRYDETGDPADLDEARSLYRQAATMGLATNSDSGLTYSMAWGNWASRRESWSEAAEAYGYGLRAMEQLFRAQLTRTNKELRVRDAQGLAAAAAYALAKSGDAAEAAVALERGRALVLSETLERNRAKLEHLTAIGRDDLVERYRRAGTQLAGLERQSLVQAKRPDMAMPLPQPARYADMADELRAARSELDAVITAIRQIDGYERFLDPPRLDDVRAAAVTTPLAYLTAAERGGFGLVVAADAVRVCWLPSLTIASVDARVGTYLEAYRSRRTEPTAWERTLDTTTRWLWDVLVEPVVTALAPAGRAALVPGGLLGLLPLHAAWREDAAAPGGRRYALDDLLLTYVPNARVRTAAAEQARTTTPEGLLAVDDPRPVAAGPLPAAGREVRAALGHFARARRLDGERATLPAVLAALGNYSVLHFACHGFADLGEPLASGLLLADSESLTLRDILRHGSLNARLAVLSACETAVPGTDLPDEVVNLPGGLLQAGVAGIVGSLWSVSDASTMALMARFYELWRVDGLDPPEALRRAQQWVRDTPNGAKRDRYPDIEELGGRRVPVKARELWERARAHRSPYYWAAFVYVGE